MSDSQSPIAVAYLYNTNGMATWCWEAAHALHELGRKVILFASVGALLPGTPAVEIVRIAPASAPPRSVPIPKSLGTALTLLASRPDGVLAQIHAYLSSRGTWPAAYVLNQSTLVDPSIPCPQLVAAWSFPVDLLPYLRKTPRLLPRVNPKAILLTSIGLVGWWRKDWRAYHAAAKVLCVTQALNHSLRDRSIDSTVAHPGTRVTEALRPAGRGIRILMAADNLGNPRKRIRWMVEAMSQMKHPGAMSLQLAGEVDGPIRDSASKLSFPVEFLGRLGREELEQAMQQAHVFCFASLLDDWGYVLVEAMANGLIPVAPARSPFDEIVGDCGFCYRSDAKTCFLAALEAAISVDIDEKRELARRRAQICFSRYAFGQAILEGMLAGNSQPAPARKRLILM
jgi:glycosyltransferase involved in cell wall biosynthesis